MMRCLTISSLFLLPLSFSAFARDPQKVLNVYTTRHYEADQQLAKEFEKKSGIHVRIVQIKEASQLIARVEEEKDKTQADLLMTADVGNLWRASQAGVFQPIASEIVNKSVPTTFRDANDLWTGVSLRVRLIAFNKEKVKPEQVSRIEDLASPTFKGRVLVRSSNHVYNQSLSASLLDALGRDGLTAWTKSISANLARRPQGGDIDQLKAVAAGEGDIAIVNSYYLARLLTSQNPSERELMKNISFVFPNQQDRGAHANLSGVGITKFARNAAYARQFIEYMVSQIGQDVFTSLSQEYSVRKDAMPPVVLRSFGQPKLDLKGLTIIGKNTPEAMKILDEAGWR